MKNYAIVIGLLLFVLQQTIIAQDKWAPIGAKWYYTAPYDGKCLAMESVADTIIQGKGCKIVELRYCSNNGLIAREFLYETGDSLQYFNYNHEEFYTLYDFSAKVGDDVKVHSKMYKPTKGYYGDRFDSINYFMYKVIKSDSIKISGKWLRRQEISDTRGGNIFNSYLSFPDKYIIEKLGNLSFLFGRNINFIVDDIDYPGLLRCYTDKNIQYESGKWLDDCLGELTSIENVKVNNLDFYLYPNPCLNSNVTIHTQKLIESISIYTIYGTKYFKANPKSLNYTILSESLKIGSNIVIVRYSDETSHIQKLIFQK